MYGTPPIFPDSNGNFLTLWSAGLQAAVDELREVTGSHGSHTDINVRSLVPTLNALASLLSPAVTGVVPTDVAAGDMTRTIGDLVKTFSDDIIDVAEDYEGVPILSFGLQRGWEAHDLLALAYELDEQARVGGDVAVNQPTFAQLSAVDQDALWTLLKGPITAPPVGPLPGLTQVLTLPASAAAISGAYVTFRALATAQLVSGYPYSTHFTTRSGWATSKYEATLAGGGYGSTVKVILTDPAEGISRPSTSGDGSFPDFIDHDWPESAEQRDLRQLAFIQANATAINPDTGNPYYVDSEAAFLQYINLKTNFAFRSYGE